MQLLHTRTASIQPIHIHNTRKLSYYFLHCLSVALVLAPCTFCYAVEELKKIGNPRWEPRGQVVISHPFSTVFDRSEEANLIKKGVVADALGGNHVLPDGPIPPAGRTSAVMFPGAQHDGPYDDELREAWAAQGFINTDVFTFKEMRNPNDLLFGRVLVPSVDAPLGVSPDGTHGPVIPNEIFPITKTRAVSFNGSTPQLVGIPRPIGALGTSGQIVDTNGDEHDYTGLNWSHVVVSEEVTWVNPNRPESGILGSYIDRRTYLDAEGNGWEITNRYWVRRPTGILGDLDYSGELDLHDYDILQQNVEVGATNLRLDIDGNGAVDDADMTHWADLVGTPEATSLTVGETYSQDFNSLGSDGAAGSALPTAWTVTDKHGMPRRRETNVPFPPSSRDLRSVSQPLAVNAGESEGDKAGERSLAIYKPLNAEETAIQLLADTDTRADALQIDFTVEAWDRIISSRNNRNGGEAKFNVTVEIDSGDRSSDLSKILGGEFNELFNLGTVSTGAVLPNPDGDYLNGNDDAHRVVFNSEVLPADIPAGSRLRFRWASSGEPDASEGWIFGIDDVSITLAVAGDTNLDGEVKFDDFLVLSNNFGQPGGWEQGDFDGNGEIDFPDFLALSANFSGAANTSAAAVPEPTGTVLAIFGLLGLIGFRKRR